MARDLYAATEHVAQALLAEGLVWHLQGIKRANRVGDNATAQTICELLAALGKVLL